VTDRRAELLARAAERASARPEYLGWVLARYMELEALDWPTLAGMLGTSEPSSRLALCLRPRPEHFAEDVRAIAARLRLDVAALAHIVRFVDARQAMAGREPGATPERGALLAARRRRERDDDRSGPSR